MLIQYTTAAGVSLAYDTGGNDVLTISDICNIASLYAQNHPMILPDSVFMHVSILTDVVKCFAGSSPISTICQDDIIRGQQRLMVHTGCGPLVIYPLPWGWQGPQVIVGTKADYDEYDIDAIFEKVVLKDCERV